MVKRIIHPEKKKESASFSIIRKDFIDFTQLCYNNYSTPSNEIQKFIRKCLLIKKLP